MIASRVVELHGSFADPILAWHRFLEVVAHVRPRLMVLGSVHHVFPGGGLTGLVLIAESHAAIHTWPERNYAWCQLATCGDPAALPCFEHWLHLVYP